MTDDATSALRQRAYRAYSSDHAGLSNATAVRLTYRRDVRPHLPSSGRVLELGCGQGGQVTLLAADGYDAYGVDISPEQVEIARAGGNDRVLLGDFRDLLRPAEWDAVVAIDVLEHLSRSELIAVFDSVHSALRPGGVLVARVPNAGSPIGGSIMYGDITHETWLTSRSVAQLAHGAGFSTVRAYPCPPMAHGFRSAARFALWKPISGVTKLALACHTGRLGGHIVTPNLKFAAVKGG